jgi:hypothetical protein
VLLRFIRRDWREMDARDAADPRSKSEPRHRHADASPVGAIEVDAVLSGAAVTRRRAVSMVRAALRATGHT